MRIPDENWSAPPENTGNNRAHLPGAHQYDLGGGEFYYPAEIGRKIDLAKVIKSSLAAAEGDKGK
jgi:hypothetical protein